MTLSYIPVIRTDFAGTSVTIVGDNDNDDVFTVAVDDDTFPQLVVNANGRIELGGGDAPADVALFRDGSVRLHTTNDFVTEGNLVCDVAGKGIRIKEGANACMGVATLVAGTVTVNNTSVTASSRIFLTIQSLGTVATPKAIGVTARVAATSFTITSADVTDTSVIAWEIKEPA
jgi:hypothetical protein